MTAWGIWLLGSVTRLSKAVPLRLRYQPPVQQSWIGRIFDTRISSQTNPGIPVADQGDVDPSPHGTGRKSTAGF